MDGSAIEFVKKIKDIGLKTAWSKTESSGKLKKELN